jgi:AcrR family transcriptional regulator
MTSAPALSDTGKPLRRDAAENRERLLDAATRVFAERGLDAGVEEVARVAGVGMGTLYRRFPSKQALVDALIGSMRLELLKLGRDAAGHTDGTGLETLLFEAAQLQADQPGCLPQLWNQSDAELDAITEFRKILVDLLECAQQHGRVRPEITSPDISMVLWSVRGVIETTRAVAPKAWRRHLELLVAGLRPAGSRRFAAELTETPVTAGQVRRINAIGSARS